MIDIAREVAAAYGDHEAARLDAVSTTIWARRRVATVEECRDAKRHRDRHVWRLAFAALAPDEELRIPPVAPPEGASQADLVWIARTVRDLAPTLSRTRHGDPWRQGWDGNGYRGLSEVPLHAAWESCRRRTGPHMRRLMVEAIENPHGWADPRLHGLSPEARRRALRTPAVVRFQRDDSKIALSTKLRAALGHLTTEVAWHVARVAARAACDAQRTLPTWHSATIIVATLRHADWDLAARLERMLRDASPEDRLRLRAALAVRTWGRRLWPGPLAPAYPRLPRRMAARVALGESVHDLAPGLTRAEAHEWATHGGYTDEDARERAREHAIWNGNSVLEDDGRAAAFSEWLCRRNDVPIVRDIAVARWLIACRQDPQRWEALTRRRILRHGDRELGVRYIDRVDEISTEDLPAGPRTGVETAFRRAVERFGGVQLAKYEADHRILAPLPAWWRPLRCATLLRTPAALVQEGREMRHCVGGYAPMVERKESIIVALCVPERTPEGIKWHRSTVELSPRGEVRQHFGAHNAAPHDLCAKALSVLRRRWMARPVQAQDVA